MYLMRQYLHSRHHSGALPSSVIFSCKADVIRIFSDTRIFFDITAGTGRY